MCEQRIPRRAHWALCLPQRPYPKRAAKRRMCQSDGHSTGVHGRTSATVVHTFRFSINLVALSAFGRLETQPVDTLHLKLCTALERVRQHPMETSTT
jgi:hypothetical protein